MARDAHRRNPSVQPRRRRRRLLGRVAFGVVMAVCAVVGFGLTGADYAAVMSFTRDVGRWQVNPDFRAVARDYCLLGSGAMAARPCGVPAARIVMAVRSCPGVPPEYAVNETSRLHYENFTRGPLCAYLHLCTEQEVSSYETAVEQLAANPAPTAADLRGWLDQRQMSFPIVRDAGAVQSLASLLADTRWSAGPRPAGVMSAGGGVSPAAAARPADPFTVRENIAGRLTPHIAALAVDLGLPTTDPRRMSAEQQRAVFDRLDDYVKQHDPELWRAKQVNDFAGGLWAQVFGPQYGLIIGPYLALYNGCRAVFILGLAAIAARHVYGRRRRRKAAAGRGRGPADDPDGGLSAVPAPVAPAA